MVYKIKEFYDLNLVLILISISLLLTLIILLNIRLRAREILTMNHLGCSRRMVLMIHFFENISIHFVAFVLALFASQVLNASIMGGRHTSSPAPNQQNILKIQTSFYPLSYFANRIGGKYVHVDCLVEENEDPVFWQPSRKVIAEFHKADLVILNGAQFEKWPQYLSLAHTNTLQSADRLKNFWLYYESGKTHSHGSKGHHSHKGLDGHTWLSPDNAMLQAGEIFRVLKKKRPLNEMIFKKNFENLNKDLTDLHKSILFLNLKGTYLLASHPAYNYLAQRYDWNIINLDLDPSTQLSQKELLEIQNILKKNKISVILWESEPSQEISEKLLKEFKLKSVVFSPCETLSKEDIKNGKDYLAVMKSNVKALKEALN